MPLPRDLTPNDVKAAREADPALAYVDVRSAMEFASGHTPGAANVYRYDPLTATTSVAYAGFTNIVDIAFDAEGDLFVLQISSNGLASPSGPGTGVLIEIDGATGERTTIASDGLFFPGGLAIGNDGALYVTNLSHLPEGGQVLRIAEVPEPQTWSLLLAGIAALAWRTRVRRAG